MSQRDQKKIISDENNEYRLRLKFVSEAGEMGWHIILDYSKKTDSKWGEDNILSTFAVRHYNLALKVYINFCKQMPKLTDMPNEYFYPTQMGEMMFRSRFSCKNFDTYQIKWRQPINKGAPANIAIAKLDYMDPTKVATSHPIAFFDSDTVDDEKSARLATIRYVKAVKNYGDSWSLYPVQEDSWEDQNKKRQQNESNDLPFWARMNSMRFIKAG